MIFDKIFLDDREFEVEGQLRIKEADEVKLIFEDLNLGTYLKELHHEDKTIDHLVIKNVEETRYDTKDVTLTHITIDGKHYHATFK
ncbi:hypothetical protein [Lacicoccus alkaliphilus]|uniref:Uncharacterized protein n=1 Tax=Lacicoccus alkaliphilus DSM 16010 TaxID=1123231 RepID=A0A1M7C3P2_9BACL|nr:hypothetical protein [Salinicoccus alkaliphilus]SHL61918.1 hypothetical protein SAMN02745189_00676 [Salinicoccus alkaliphilus DSM 16010]